MEKKKRRSSQVFHFEQTQETLEENEKLKELYQNKNYVLPEVKEFETIVEERSDVGNAQRSRRAAQTVSPDGGLILGMQLGKRMIMEYKYWKQDDKERIKRRKAMMTKQWKGRRRPKILYLDAVGEQKLHDLIDLKDDSACDDSIQHDDTCSIYELQSKHTSELCVWGKRLLDVDSSIEEGDGCIWQGHECEVGQEAIESSINFCGGSKCDIRQSEVGLETNDQQVDEEGKNKTLYSDLLNTFIKSNNLVPEGEPVNDDDKIQNSTHLGQSPSRRQSDLNNSIPIPNHNQSDVSLAALCNIIPESELAELLNSTDLLFCGSGKPDVKVSQNGRRSVRRSARLNAPLGTGSVYTEESVPGQIQSGLCQIIQPVTAEVTKKNDQVVKNITSCEVSNKASTSLYAVHATPPLDHTRSSKESPVSKTNKKIKTKSRILEQPQTEDIANAVLKDLSNLMINPVSNIHDDISKSKNRLAANSNKSSKMRVVSKSKDEGCSFSVNLGNDINTSNDRVERRKSLRSAGKRSILINYCEDSESSGTSSRRTSDEVSKNSASDVRQSSLVISGDIDISLPDSVRRSFTGEFVPRKSLQTVLELPLDDIKENKYNSTWSDSDEEVISGIYGKKTLVPRKRKIKKK